MMRSNLIAILVAGALAAPAFGQGVPPRQPEVALPPPPPLPPPPGQPGQQPPPPPAPPAAPRPPAQPQGPQPGPAVTAPAQERPGVGVSGPGPQYGERVVQRTGPAGQQITIRSGQPGIPNAADYRIDFDALDRTGRGYITRNDVPSGHPLQSEFHVVDRNRDGRLTREELSGWLR
ncbi:hypothetical protein [Coralloluteibacterium thermophilus]|uniref:EF-hand domain-containing protein n=1 Tax=Coralloluteibacterium thermophilum TaxID=2707049 RepID=A0ABV9NHV4_9GAMM